MSIEFLNTDFEKVSYLFNLLVSHATGKLADSNEYEALRRELLNDPELADCLPRWVKLHRNLDSFWGFIQPKFSSYAARRTYLSEEFSPLLDTLEFGLKPTQEKYSALQEKGRQNSPIAGNVSRNKEKVFIVHGHDNEVKQEISRFIEKIGLEAIVLHEQASSGMTIIEKIEHYSSDADFALVLYTACDHGRDILETKAPPKNRARQNVVFEHGCLYLSLRQHSL